MATFRTYKCRGCGYTVETDPRGHYALMSGEYFNFRCKQCKEVVSISFNELANPNCFPTCPVCGAPQENLFTWNPIEGKCPKCGKKMVEDKTLGVIMDD